MARRVRAEQHPATPATDLQSEAAGDETRTLVVSGLSGAAYRALLLKTFRETLDHPGTRISVAGTVREIIEEWHKREGEALLRPVRP
jgi:hypothetical protein